MTILSNLQEIDELAVKLQTWLMDNDYQAGMACLAMMTLIVNQAGGNPKLLKDSFEFMQVLFDTKKIEKRSSK